MIVAVPLTATSVMRGRFNSLIEASFEGARPEFRASVAMHCVGFLLTFFKAVLRRRGTAVRRRRRGRGSARAVATAVVLVGTR